MSKNWVITKVDAYSNESEGRAFETQSELVDYCMKNIQWPNVVDYVEKVGSFTNKFTLLV